MLAGRDCRRIYQVAGTEPAGHVGDDVIYQHLSVGGGTGGDRRRGSHLKTTEHP